MSEPLRYRAAPFDAVRAREGNTLVSSPLSGERRLIPDGVFALLDQLRAFRTLAQHAEIASRRMGNADVRKGLEDLRRQGLLMSEEEFFLAALPSGPVSPAAISAIGFPTSGQSGTIERCIESYSSHAARYGREVRFVIAGGYAGRSLNEALVASMIQAGIDPSIARFALLGEAEGLPAGVARTTGANRNALLLACAGEAFLSVDDDTVCSLARSPAHHDGLAFHSSASPLEMWFGPELPASGPDEIDLLKEAGNALGPAVRDVRSLLPADFDHATMEKLCRGNARIRVAQIGLKGDAATDSPVGWLTATGATRERLVGSEAAYRAAVASRQLLAVAPCETVSASRQLMAYCIALDNRDPLPPFAPLGRDQDGVFGAWLRLAESESFTAHLPFAVSHEPSEARTFPPAESWLLPGMPLNDFLHMLCENAEPAVAPDRMKALGSMLEEPGGLSRADFRELLIERRLRYLLSTDLFFRDGAEDVRLPAGLVGAISSGWSVRPKKRWPVGISSALPRLGRARQTIRWRFGRIMSDGADVCCVNGLRCARRRSLTRRVDLVTQNVPHHRAQLLHREGFDQQRIALLDHVPLHHLSAIVSGHEDHFDIGPHQSDLIRDHGPAHAGRNHVGQQQIHTGIVPEKTDRVFPAVRRKNPISIPRQHRGNELANLGFIVHHKNRPGLRIGH